MRLITLCALLGALLLSAPCARIAVADDTRASIAFECKNKLGRSALEGALNQVQSEYQKIDSLSAAFDQDSHLAALNQSETSHGKVLFSKPGKMRWSYEDPEPQEFVLNDRTVWLYQPEIKQVIIDELSKVLISDLPVAFLMGVGSLKSEFVLDGGCKSSLGTVLHLTPKSARQASEGGEGAALKSFKLLVSPAGLPAGAQVLDSVGNVTTIALDSLKANASVAADAFEIQYAPGTDINDRRHKSGDGEG